MLNIGSPFKIENEPYILASRTQVSAKPNTSSSSGSVSQQSDEVEQNTLGDTRKNNFLPTLIIMAVVIACATIVSLSRRKAR